MQTGEIMVSSSDALWNAVREVGASLSEAMFVFVQFGTVLLWRGMLRGGAVRFMLWYEARVREIMLRSSGEMRQ